MAKIIQTAGLGPKTHLTPDEVAWVYNGLDCAVTSEVCAALRAELASSPANVQETYATAMRKLAPVNYMCITGLNVNMKARDYAIREYKRDLVLLNKRFDRIMQEVMGYTVNWRSPVQLKQFFYTALGLRPIRKRNAKGQFAPTTNSDALERLSANPFARVFCNYILTMREIGKKISFLETEIDPDGKIRTSLNIAGTDTGRFASAFSAFGTGSNLQNVENRLRAVFVPDPGYIFVNVDLEQADARTVGARIWNCFLHSHGPEAAGAYLDACESGDLHSRVTKMVWPELEWPRNDDPKATREIADQIFYRQHSYRDMAKRLGHGTNFLGTPRTMAMHTKTETSIIEIFQIKYFKAFPLIGNVNHDLTKPCWHSWVYDQLREHQSLTTLFGRRRQFFNRYKDPNTLRAAIAYEPQSCTGEFLDRGWLQLWDAMPEAQLKMPVHDSILFQIPFEALNELLPRALELLKVTIMLEGDRPYTIPLEAKVGWNWADSRFNKKTGMWENPNGLRKWTGAETREPPKTGRNRFKAYLT